MRPALLTLAAAIALLASPAFADRAPTQEERVAVEANLRAEGFTRWESIELGLELLPALRSVDRNGGKLSVDKELYGRATGLVGKCQSLASPQLAGDLKRAKALVESRATELDSHQLLIDLNE